MQSTRLFIIFIIGTCMVFNVFVWHFYGVEYTISRTLTEWSRTNPIIPFIFGMCVGHFFWNF